MKFGGTSLTFIDWKGFANNDGVSLMLQLYVSQYCYAIKPKYII